MAAARAGLTAAEKLSGAARKSALSTLATKLHGDARGARDDQGHTRRHVGGRPGQRNEVTKLESKPPPNADAFSGGFALAGSGLGSGPRVFPTDLRPQTSKPEGNFTTIGFAHGQRIRRERLSRPGRDSPEAGTRSLEVLLSFMPPGLSRGIVPRTTA